EVVESVEAAPPPRSEMPPRRERDRDRDRRRRRDDDDDDTPIIGFGDHLPAFLLRAARPKTAPVPEQGEEG
ncbi:MAG TPA: DNA helicase, partial [Azospirillum sp.]